MICLRTPDTSLSAPVLLHTALWWGPYHVCLAKSWPPGTRRERGWTTGCLASHELLVISLKEAHEVHDWDVGGRVRACIWLFGVERRYYLMAWNVTSRCMSTGSYYLWTLGLWRGSGWRSWCRRWCWPVLYDASSFKSYQESFLSSSDSLPTPNFIKLLGVESYGVEL